ncbi:unnamed protein product [Allacma fusca]|uniref:Protein sleepless n=1 Tax=Allacma fusca TaxID=39272 RepID=A0A8J2LUQ2_9HEXA|nr:unnamed protein product [Allacma fusca]
MDNLKNLLVVFVVVTCMGATLSIKCWVCNSKYDIGCADPFDNSSFPISDCNSAENLKPHLGDVPATMCRKMVQKVKGEWRYIRSCAFLGEPGIGGDGRFCKRSLTGTYDIYIEDCTCISKDGCNKSISLNASVVVSLFCILLVLLVKYPQ